ncbi:MAG: bifunctional [glutamine synthetase] adenylyltransferase/[glutamine synthetase]-adenylyl-L-tyrosine phosphorylase [Pseudomonadota bacterium]
MSDLAGLSPALDDLLSGESGARELLAGVCQGSGYLKTLIRRLPDFTASAFNQSGDDLFDGVISNAAASWQNAGDQSELMACLRIEKSRAALLAALYDLAGWWTAARVTDLLTRFADAALSSALNFQLKAAAATGKFVPDQESDPSARCGYFVLGMGKYGAHELNYSSDIDLIALFDSERNGCAEGVEASVFFTRLTRQLVAIMQDITGDGYVFRMDLRLRPDPRSTPLAISINAAANYYQSMGQNWERAALIKARVVAGDLPLGESLLAELQPFVFRRNLDFAAIADVQSLKRQIHAHKGHGEVAIAGHNIKLGRGGIREIEFFVQTQQLIAGGRASTLRGRRTIEMLTALREAGWISAEAEEELSESYWYLRTIEHRLQMQEDAQTHSLPEDPGLLTRLAAFCGYGNFEDFSGELHGHLTRVEEHYAGLFEEAGDLSVEEGSLSFTGAADDPDTLQTLQSLGFRQPGEVSSIIRGWHHGRFPATRSERARELLTELMPHILKSLSNSIDPDAAFVTFDKFLTGLPTGVQLFSLLKANTNLLDLFGTVMGSAPRLAEILAKRPRTLDAMLDPGFFEAMPDAEELMPLVTDAVSSAGSLEEALDLARAVGQEQMFRIGVRFLTATASRRQVGEAYSSLADALIDSLLAAVRSDIHAKHGAMPGGKFVVVAMGKLGGQEMTASSDLDLMTVYDVPVDVIASDGAKPLSPAQYFGRITQRLIAALSAPTAEGLLYEVDMRLRPSGSKGPISVSLASTRSYHAESAWTWERMALSRARVVAGDPELMDMVSDEFRAILTAQRDEADLRQDVIDMRLRMLSELYRGDPWDLKQRPGGLVEVEFVAQYLQLKHAWERPDVLHPNVRAALSRLRDNGLLQREHSDCLSGAYEFYQTLTQLLRLCATGRFSPDEASNDLKTLMTSSVGEADFARLEVRLELTSTAVRRAYEEVLEAKVNAD